MGRASSSKKVARAARAAGRPGTGRNWLWPTAIVALVAVGVTLVVISRGTDEASAEAPTFGDHWHAAFGVYACDEFTDQVTDQNGDANGIHTHPDGLIHIHPTSAQATGDKATLGVFAEEVGLTVEDDRLELSGGDSFVEGEDECGAKPGIVQVAVWDDPSDETPDLRTEDVADLKLAENQVVTLAFAPEGADIPKPPSTENLAAPEDLQGSTVPGADPSTGSTVPGSTPAPDGSTSSTPPADGSTTTAPPSDSTTSSAP
jgi:hypothetical protein